ncbi:hypothetical protein LC724_33805 [Blautia sp. RD014234]|nr:hypothetical protein [Blautia parvula]
MIRGKGRKSLRQKAFFMLAVFLVMMMVFTVISRAADSVTIAQVDVENMSSKAIEHPVVGEGTVKENLEKAISTEPNIMVETLYAAQGSQVEEGELLMQLRMADIEEQIENLNTEIKKLELNNQDLGSRKQSEQQKNPYRPRGPERITTGPRRKAETAWPRHRQRLPGRRQSWRNFIRPGRKRAAVRS